MKRIVISLIVAIGSAGLTSAAELENSRAASMGALNMNIGVGMRTDIPVTPAPVKEVFWNSQGLVGKFDLVRKDLFRLESATTWLASDIDRVGTALRIAKTKGDPSSFQRELKIISFSVRRHNAAAGRVRIKVMNLMKLAQKDAELNGIARDMERDADDLLKNAEHYIENAALRLEWAVRGADHGLVGGEAQLEAMNISRDSRELSFKARDISLDAKLLRSRTQP